MYVGGWLAGPGRDLLGQLCGGLLRRCSPWRKIKKGGVGEGGDWVYHLKPIFSMNMLSTCLGQIIINPQIGVYRNTISKG